MTHETDMLLDDGFGDDLPDKPLLGSVDGEPEAIASPGEFERQHHALLERQGHGSDDAELVHDAGAFVARTRAVGATLEDPRIRQHCQSILDYWSIFVYRIAQAEIDADLLPFDPSLAPSLEDAQFPYQFEEEMGNRAQQMLGWRRLLDECERDLAGDHLLTVMGEIGAGVRFVIHSLVLPTLRSGRARLKEFSGSDQWRYYEIPLGKEPVVDLLQAIARQEGHDAQWVAQREDEFRDDKTTLSRILKTDSEHPAVLVFHHFGSLLKASSKERTPTIDNLAHLLQDSQQRFYAITALRRDHTIALSKFGPLEKRLRDGHVLMAFTTAELRHLIEEPARRVGLVFEPGLIDQILIDIQGESTALPLLRFTLARLWKHRERNRITWDAYRQTGAGRTALRIAMDKVYGELTEDQQETLRQILLAMVNLEPDGSFSTCEVSREDLDRICGDKTQVDEVLEKLQRQELVRKSCEKEQVTFAVAYNALLISWPPLISWLDELRVRERFRLRLRQAATLWNERGKPKDLLWQGAMLVEANEEFDQDTSLTTNEQDFLRTSRTRETAKRRTRQLVAGSIALAIVGILISMIVVQKKDKEIAWRNMEIARQSGEISEQKNAILYAELAEKNARTIAERGERMHGNALDSLAKGDLPAALLWFDARDGITARTPADSDDAERRARQLARLQLPQLADLESVEDVETDAFEGIAVSPDQTYLAAIQREGSKSSEGNRKVVRVYSLANSSKDLPLIDSFSLEESGNTTDSVAFAELGAGASKNEYLLVGADQLYAWKRDGERWTKADVHWPQSDLDASIVSLGIDGASTMLTVHQEKTKRWLRIWKLVSAPGTGDLQLEALPDLAPLSGKHVQLARLSTDGHLLAVCGDKPDEPSELLAWFKHPNKDHWELASPPAWVKRLDSKDQQRLYDWGWILTADTNAETENGSNWQRAGSWIRAASFSPNGEQFATACDDGQVLIWSLTKSEQETGSEESEAASETLMVTPQFETELSLGTSVFDVAFLTEDVIITGGRDRTARIWDIHIAAEIAPPTYHEGTVTRVAPAGPRTLVTTTARVRRIWHSKDYQEIKSPFTAQAVAISDDMRRIVYARNGSAEGEKDSRGAAKEIALPLLDPRIIDVDDIRSAVISADGKWIFTASRGDEGGKITMEVRAWSDSERQLQLKWPLDLKDFPFGSAKLTRKTLDMLKWPPELEDIPLAAFSSSGEWLAVAEKARSEDPPRLIVWNVESLQSGMASGEIELPMLPRPKNAELNSAVTIEKMAFVQFENSDVLALVGKEKIDSDKEHGIIFFGIPDREQEPSAWKLCRVEVNNSDDSFPHEQQVLCLAFSEDGQLLATGDARDRAKLWRVEELVKQARQSSDKRIIASPTADLSHSSDVVYLAFGPRSSNGERMLATVSSEGEASVWSISETGTNKDAPEYRLQHDAKILAVSFSPNGKWIITGGEDSTARIWDGEAGLRVGIFRHQGPVVRAWQPRDGQVLTVSKSSRKSGQEPPLHVRHWSVSSSNSTEPSQEDLEKLAARKVVDMRLDVLQPSDFASSR
ncbi:MAG: WD40 repeat domain-containing protein [Candidatus Paceibacterota bacterium]